MMLAVLCSRRFHPGHVSHLMASQEMFLFNGYRVLFRTHFKYEKEFEIKGVRNEIQFNSLLSLSKDDLFIVWFPSFAALFDVIFVKIFTPSKIIFIYHEPFESIFSYYKAGFKVFQIIKILIASLVNALLCTLAKKVILPSNRAFHALADTKKLSDKFAQLNLIFPDEINSGELLSVDNRYYISYIGTIAADHAFDVFIESVYQCIKNNSLSEFKFIIATKSVLPGDLLEKIRYCQNSGRLFVQSGVAMSNIEINSYYQRSFLVWNAYRRSMQSGVLPKAYMCGTPVLISENNQSEFFKHGVNGALISSDCGVEDFIGAVVFVKEHWTLMSINCRENFLRNFHWKSQNINFFKFIKEQHDSKN